MRPRLAALLLPLALLGCSTTATPTSTPGDTASASAPPAGQGTPASAPQPAATTPKATPSSTTTRGPYKRAEFTLTGRDWDWTDLDRIPALDRPGPQCDGRQETVKAYTTNQVRTTTCYVLQGDVYDWYTGTTTKGALTSAYDADHVVALADAWDSGAWAWTRAKRTAFANDPRGIVLTQATTNRGKGARGPDQWTPANKARACAYVNRYALIKRTWRLRLDRAERQAIRHTRETTC